MIQKVLEMRDDVSRAIQVGDMQVVDLTSSKLEKTQRALEHRLREVQVHVTSLDEEGSAHSTRSASDDDLTMDEVVFLQAQLEEKIKTIDPTTQEGAADLRACFKRTRTLDEAL